MLRRNAFRFTLGIAVAALMVWAASCAVNPVTGRKELMLLSAGDELAGAGMGMLFMSFSRDNERQADDLGVLYSSKAGYDARHMANMFVTLGRLNPGEGRDGLPAWFSTHPNPPDRIAAIQKDDRVYAFLGYAAQAQFQSYASTFDQTMSRFANLTDPARINVEPQRLAVRKTARQGSLRQALQGFGVAQDKLEAHAILNGMKLDDTVPAGALVKTVVK